MTDLTNVPIADLFAEIERREKVFSDCLSQIDSWRCTLTSKVSPECIAKGRAIVAAVAQKFNVTAEAIMGRSREMRIAKARQIAMASLFVEISCQKEVALFFDRNHGTVIHAIKSVKPSSILSVP